MLVGADLKYFSYRVCVLANHKLMKSGFNIIAVLKLKLEHGYYIKQ